MTYAARLHLLRGALLRQYLRKGRGSVTVAARLAGLGRTHFHDLMTVHGIKGPARPSRQSPRWWTECRDMRAQGMAVEALAQHFGKHSAHVHRVLRGMPDAGRGFAMDAWLASPRPGTGL